MAGERIAEQASSQTYPPSESPTSTSRLAQSQAAKESAKNKRRSMLDYFRAKRATKEDKGKQAERDETTAASVSTGTGATATNAGDKGKGKEKATERLQQDEPVLNDEDEAFLTRIISEPEGPAPPLPQRPGSTTTVPLSKVAEEPVKSTDAQVVLMQGADRVPLPDAPETPEGEVATAIEGDGSKTDTKQTKKNNRWSWLKRSSSRSAKQTDTAVSLQSAAEALKAQPKPADAKPNEEGQVAPHEAKKEEDEMQACLEQLNLSAVNNRVFSISDESKTLLKNFTLVLKDLVNGVPTAYHDLESLLTNSDDTLQKAYKSLPPFLQELVEKLPEKFGKSLGPEFLAAAAEKPGAKTAGNSFVNKGASYATEKLGVKLKIPNLKDLVTKQGTLVALLRSVVQALRTRFPAFLGMNVLWSLALFVLLFVFWYCHKRGREVRLEKERKLTEAEMAEIAARVASDPAWTPPPGWAEGTMTTRALEGASTEDVVAGMLPAIEDVPDGAYAPEGSLGKALKDDEDRKKREATEKEIEQSAATDHAA